MANPEEERLARIKAGLKKPVRPAVKVPAKPAVKLPAKPAAKLPAKPAVKLPAKPAAKTTVKPAAKRPVLKIKAPTAAKPRVVPPKIAALRPKVVNPIVAAIPAAPAAVKTLAEHKVKDDDTLSGIALKYYGSAKKDFWMYIYNANKDVIGDRPNVLRPGIVLRIPAKPEL